MFPNTSTQSQDLFKDCLGFARQLSQSPGLYCRLELKISLNSRLEVLASFLAKGNVLVITGDSREDGNLLERGCLLLVTME